MALKSSMIIQIALTENYLIITLAKQKSFQYNILMYVFWQFSIHCLLKSHIKTTHDISYRYK